MTDAFGPHDWIAVCDGGKALFFENVGDAVYPDLRLRESYAFDNPPTRLQGTDAPARVRGFDTSSGSAIEQTDWHDLAEREFLRGVVETLHERVTAGKARGVHLVAPARALGVLRAALPADLRKVLKSEREHDYVNMPTDEIERHLTAK